MKLYVKSSHYITQSINKFQNKEISKNILNRNILLNTIFTYYFLKKEDKIYKPIKELQTKTFNSFYKVEAVQQQHERQLKSKIRDKESKKIVEQSIQAEREKLLKDLSKNKEVTIFAEHSYNAYIPSINISLSYNFQAKNKNNNNKKYISYSNIIIQSINPNWSQKGNKMNIKSYVEPPFLEDFNFDTNQSYENEKKCNNNIINDNINDNNNQNEVFMDMITNVDDDILFYDEKIGKNEKKENLKNWTNNFTKDEFLNDFQDLKYRKTETIKGVDDLFFEFEQNRKLKRKIDSYVENYIKIYDEIAKQDHYKEFVEHLSENTYKFYMKKMNYSYLSMMLKKFCEYKKYAKDYLDIVEDESIILVIFIKKLLLFSGLSSSKIYESVTNIASSKKKNITFEDYLSCFKPIFNLSESYQNYKYGFLLYLVKNNDNDIITLPNYKNFLHIIRGKLIYSEVTYDDIVGRLLFILKRKYPRDDMENLNFRHLSIYLQYLVNYEYGE